MLTNRTPVIRNDTTRSTLFPRSSASDPMVRAAKVANITARLELDRRRREARPVDRITELERRIEHLESCFINHTMDLVDRAEDGGVHG